MRHVSVIPDQAVFPVHTVTGPKARKVWRTPDKPKVGDLGAIWGIPADCIRRTSKRDVYNALTINTRPSSRSVWMYILNSPGYASLTWGSTYFSALRASDYIFHLMHRNLDLNLNSPGYPSLTWGSTYFSALRASDYIFHPMRRNFDLNLNSPGYASLTWGSTYFSAVLCSLSNLEQSAFGDDEPLTIFFTLCTGILT